jgi:(p)ppGpp synthase/HD superfamily hydrolase
MQEWLRVLKAADAAARWHVHQRRKGPAEEPYINHLVEVAMLVAEATDGGDTNLDERFHETTQLHLGLSIHGMRRFRASHIFEL